MISKGDWGIGYLAGTGISLIVVLIWWFMLGNDPTFTAFVGTITGIILSLALIYLALWLSRSELEHEHIWAVSRWGAIGLALPTLPLAAVALMGLDTALNIESSVLVNIAAASAVIGALFGAVTELEGEHLRALTLNRRNAVLNRVLRHDIRNDAGLLLVFAERLEEEFDTAGDELADPIRKKTEEIIETSEAAKRVETLNQDTDRHPVDVVDIVTDQVTTVERTQPAVDIECDLPEEALVSASELLRTVIDNLIENAIQHNDRQPSIQIAVTPSDARHGEIEITIADNGPGLPTDIAETLTTHGISDPSVATTPIGLGLWLVKWFVETYDGDLTIEDNTPRGTIVRIALPQPEAQQHQATLLESAF